MNFNEYQELADATAVYPKAGSGLPDAITYCLLGLSEESGEVLGVVKKFVRNGGSLFELDDIVLRKLVEEMGDVLWYISAIATELSIDMNWIAEINIEKLAARQRMGELKNRGQ